MNYYKSGLHNKKLLETYYYQKKKKELKDEQVRDKDRAKIKL